LRAHRTFNRCLGNTDDLCNLFDRLAVVINQVDHLALFRGQGRGLLVKFRFGPAAAGCERFVAGDGE
jgi:hypothetical protein